jgi:hypothetical protein
MPLDSLLSTQGIMVLLLAAYAGAMWMFLSSAPKVHTMMVSDLEAARELYEGVLNMSVATVPLHYYYDYEQTIGSAGLDPMYLASPAGRSIVRPGRPSDGLWYQLKKNTQLHVISGASRDEKNRDRHVCFDRECLEMILMRVQTRGIQHKIRGEKPLNFLLKDYQGRVIELAEVVT